MLEPGEYDFCKGSIYETICDQDITWINVAKPQSNTLDTLANACGFSEALWSTIAEWAKVVGVMHSVYLRSTCNNILYLIAYTSKGYVLELTIGPVHPKFPWQNMNLTEYIKHGLYVHQVFFGTESKPELKLSLNRFLYHINQQYLHHLSRTLPWNY